MIVKIQIYGKIDLKKASTRTNELAQVAEKAPSILGAFSMLPLRGL